MALFSQRKGIRPLEKAIQRESIDDELRNRLWNALKIAIWDKHLAPSVYGYDRSETRRVLAIVESIWLHHFKYPLDTIPKFDGYPKSAYQILREAFFTAKWYEVYDFLEFIAKNAGREWSARLVALCNEFLQAENAAYRFVGNEIVEITSEHEVAAIEGALARSTRASREHLTRALELLSDRSNPDYRNSIKESISAVESTCQLISGNLKGTLGECLKSLKTAAPIHPALEAAFSKLYGYTSDDGGIRHALTEGSSNASFSDAKFMLVACSAFSSFLLARAAESGMDLNGA